MTVPTFKAAATQVHAEHRKTFKNAKHAAWWLQSLVNDVFPIIGAAAHRHDRLRRRAASADADLDGEAGNRTPASNSG